MTEIINWLGNNILPVDRVQARTIQMKTLRFYIEREVLYKRGFKGPNLRCVGPVEARLIMQEIHEGTCGSHSRGRVLAERFLGKDIIGQVFERMQETLLLVAMNVKGSLTYLTNQMSSRDPR